MSQSTPREPQALLRIQTVAELTGVPEPTLRAWERRYGIPAPERTPSGYRLYGELDVEQVREMRRLCDDGIAAAEAARLVKARRAEEKSPERAPSSPGRTGHGAMTQAILSAVEQFDEEALDEAVRKLMFVGSATAVLEGIIQPALREIGRRWHAGELSVAQEHLASQRLGTVLRDLTRLVRPGSGRRAVLGCFADETHELGLLGVALHFAQWGLRPIFLGARTPPSAVRDAVMKSRPDLVALSVSVTPDRARARELATEYASACRAVPWIVGGPGVKGIEDLVDAAGGVVFTEDVAALRDRVQRLVSGQRRKVRS
jgi:DNA-binding transcriptional MerR regulator